MEQDGGAFMRSTFRISLAEFMDFNLRQADRFAEKKARSFRITGLLCLTVSLCVLGWLLMRRQFNLFLVFAAVFVMVFGIYQLLYFPAILPFAMKKSVQKAYRQSRYLQNDVTLVLYGDYFVEISAEGEKRTEQSEITAFEDNGPYYRVSLKSGNSLLLPKRAFSGEEAERLTRFCKGSSEMAKQEK